MRIIKKIQVQSTNLNLARRQKKLRRKKKMKFFLGKNVANMTGNSIEAKLLKNLTTSIVMNF